MSIYGLLKTIRTNLVIKNAPSLKSSKNSTSLSVLNAFSNLNANRNLNAIGSGSARSFSASISTEAPIPSALKALRFYN